MMRFSQRTKKKKQKNCTIRMVNLSARFLFIIEIIFFIYLKINFDSLDLRSLLRIFLNKKKKKVTNFFSRVAIVKIFF